jgi:hypothetical protein
MLRIFGFHETQMWKLNKLDPFWICGTFCYWISKAHRSYHCVRKLPLKFLGILTFKVEFFPVGHNALHSVDIHFLFYADFLVGLLLDFQDEGQIFLRKFSLILKDYKSLCQRRENLWSRLVVRFRYLILGP